jgi:hypothetical protein
VLQATAAVVTLAIVLWSLGLPSFRFAEAAALTTVSDTLSTSEPSVGSTHTIEFTTPTGVANGQTITIDFSAFTGTSSITAADISVATTSGATSIVAAACAGGVDVGADFGVADEILTLTFCGVENDFIAANGTTTITVGGTNELVNPGVVDSYDVPISTSSGDSGEARVAIVNVVTVTASVDTILNFSVAGVTTGQTVHGTTTGTSTSATAIAFGELDPGQPITGAQDLTITTNAVNGYTVTVTADGQLTAGGADIDGFRNGTYDASPQAWVSPSANVADENTWGHWGLISEDTDLFPTTETWVSASTTAVDIMTHTGPVNATTTRVGYTVEISSLQEASENYQAILTYVATPVF